MTAVLTDPETDQEYHMLGEMYVCPYTTKSAEVFSEHPKYDGLVTLFQLSFTTSASKGCVSFCYLPLEERFLPKNAIRCLYDEHGNDVLLPMNDLREDALKMRLVMRPAQPFQGVETVEEIIRRDPMVVAGLQKNQDTVDAVCSFAKTFLHSIF